MERWQKAERLWATLVAAHGEPLSISELDAAERVAALEADRIFAIGVMRDGYGGGSVGFTRAGADLRDELDSGTVAHDRWSWTHLRVFADGYRLSDGELATLNGNAWESLSDVGA